MEKALLMVSFGTSYPETLEKNISRIEAAVSAALPGRDLFRAFTSGMILRKLAQRDGVHIDNVDQALERLARQGYEDVLLQPTHILNGEEYDKLCAQAEPWRGRFARFAVGNPLLTTAEDYLAAADAVMESIPAPGADEALVFMGHGSAHFANSAYALLEYALHDRGWDRAFLGTVEGYPALDQVLRRLRERSGVRRVRLQPFMVVAGDHAANDMAGGEEDSWKSRLEREGYAVECVLRGLGEYPAFRALFAGHALAAQGEEERDKRPD
ncbi:MAG: sirohydrochlorin cobaltochelatase [Clostridiales bacterium]|nr:sirohydrochlorin cobaltochelatase [Clostridiales bacterium]